MRSSKSRSRSKSNRQRSLGNVVNRVFDSSGPEGKVRGTPQQIIEKYLTLARDAQLSNDRVAEQSFLQHAEHYTRMLGEAQREMAERQGQNQGQSHGRPSDEDGAYPNHGYGQNGHGQNGTGHAGGQNGTHHAGQGGGVQGGASQGEGHAQRRDASREGGRDQQGRDPQFRDQQPREAQPRDPQGRDPQAARPRPEPQEPAEAASLPEVLPTRDEDAAAPVPTPEAEGTTKPARSRTPRPRAPRNAPDGDAVERKPVRSRRKPVVQEGAAAPDAGTGNRSDAEGRPADHQPAGTGPDHD